MQLLEIYKNNKLETVINIENIEYYEVDRTHTVLGDYDGVCIHLHKDECLFLHVPIYEFTQVLLKDTNGPITLKIDK